MHFTSLHYSSGVCSCKNRLRSSWVSKISLGIPSRKLCCRGQFGATEEEKKLGNCLNNGNNNKYLGWCCQFIHAFRLFIDISWVIGIDVPITIMIFLIELILLLLLILILLLFFSECFSPTPNENRQQQTSKQFITWGLYSLPNDNCSRKSAIGNQVDVRWPVRMPLNSKITQISLFIYH